MMNVEKILETIKENDYSVVAIRHCCPDEEYKIGDIIFYYSILQGE